MMRSVFLSRRLVVAGAAVAAAGVLLSACTETASDFNPNAAPRARAPGVPVALVSLEGAPETITSRLSSALSQQASQRDIQIVGIDGNPRYRVRGYVSLQATAESRSGMAWAFDIFDSKQKRARRLSGMEALSSGGNSWSEVTDGDLQKVGFRALDDIAEFLSGTPEAAVARNQIGSAERGSKASGVSLHAASQ